MENLRNVMYTAQQEDGYWGYCDLQNKCIRIDWRIGKRLRQTVLHEIAHAVRGVPGHDKEWCQIAERLGCTFPDLLPFLLRLKNTES